jgi:hypothetical protein
MAKKIIGIIVAALMVTSLFFVFVPGVKADSSDVKILSYSWYVSPADSYTSWQGELVVVGEIQNIGTSVIDLPWVQAVAYSADGTPLASVYNSAYVKDMLPQQKAPFYLEFTADAVMPDSNYTGITWVPLVDHVEVAVGYAASAEDQMYRGVTLTGKTSYSMNGVYTVTGIIENNGSKLAGKVWAVTTFYDASGTAVAVNYTNFLTSSLAPGSTIPFTATPIDNTASLSGKIESYSVIVQNLPPDDTTSASPTPPISGTPSASPSGSLQPSQSPGSSSQPTGSNDLLYALVGAAVVVVVVVAMLIIRKRRM